MRASGVDVPKPLVRVSGRPLIEWNVRALRKAGIDDVRVSVSAGQTSIREWIDAAGLPAVVETTPLGNIGAAGLRAGSCERLLVVFADNLTDLDLRALLAAHEGALTLAAHEHVLRLDYGRLEIEGGRVRAYSEKPEIRSVVSSGLYVLGPQAMQIVKDIGRCGASQMVREVLDAGGRVGAFRHEAAWVDVNDASKLEEAEAVAAAIG